MRKAGLAFLAVGAFIALGLFCLYAYIFSGILIFRSWPMLSLDLGWPLAGVFFLIFTVSYSAILNFLLKKASK